MTNLATCLMLCWIAFMRVPDRQHRGMYATAADNLSVVRPVLFMKSSLGGSGSKVDQSVSRRATKEQGLRHLRHRVQVNSISTKESGSRNQ